MREAPSCVAVTSKLSIARPMAVGVTSPVPEMVIASEAATGEVMQRIAASVRDIKMAEQVRSAPMLAHWFLLDTLLLANHANRDGGSPPPPNADNQPPASGAW